MEVTMHIGITAVRDNHLVDFEHYKLLQAAFERLGHTVDFALLKATLRGKAELSALLTEAGRDLPFDLHLLCQVYQAPTFDVPLQAKKAWAYRQDDCPAIYSCRSIQNCLWKPHYSMDHFRNERIVDVQMPYGVPAIPLQQIREALSQDRTYDVVWSGNENVFMGSSMVYRVTWLDEFESIWKAAGQPFSFLRNEKHLGQQGGFANLLQQSKILLCLRGCADYSFRLFEGLASGCCCIAQPMQKVLDWASPIGVEWTETPQEAFDQIVTLLSAGAYQYVAETGKAWFDLAYGAEALNEWADKTVQTMLAE
jgi:hypothetical protein